MPSRILFCSRAGLNMSYPLTERNLLQLNVTFGYKEYLQHSQYSRLVRAIGSALSYDIYVKDFWINPTTGSAMFRMPPSKPPSPTRHLRNRSKHSRLQHHLDWRTSR